MELRRTRVESAATYFGFLLSIVILLLRASGEGLLEKGDGVNHYLISKWAWAHPMLFLDLWGKPLFTLLASPFAQLGHVGVAGFNTIVAATTAWIGVRALRSAGGASQFVFPLLVLLAPEYLLMSMAGMTEPLFGLLTVITVVLLMTDRPIAAAVVASLTPFSRPEYVVFLPMIAAWLVYDRKWRALPYCLLGLGAYAAIVTIAHGDPFWFWNKDPYEQPNGVYGSGPLNFFVSTLETVYGRPMLSLGVVALLIWPLLYWRDVEHRRHHRMMLAVAALPVVAVIAVHSLLWWKGWRGSAGLTRVLVTTIPLAALFALFVLGRGGVLLLNRYRNGSFLAVLIVISTCSWAVFDLVEQVDVPVRPDMNQVVLDAVSASVKESRQDDERVFSTHPYVAFRAGMDPYDTDQYHHLWGLEGDEVDQRFKIGDLLVWDSQLGSNESNIPLEQLLNDRRFAVLAVFYPSEGYRVLGGHLYEVFLFERRDVVRSFTLDTLVANGRVMAPLAIRADTLPCSLPAMAKWCLNDGEFPLEMKALALPTNDDIFDEWSVSGMASVQEGSPLQLVQTQLLNGRGVRYEQESIPSGPFRFERRISRSVRSNELGIYFWNIGRKSFNLEGLTVVRKRWTQRPE